MNRAPAKRFQDMLVWQKALALTVEVYKLTGRMPKEESFGLVSQMRRASVSTASNIAEGFGRQSNKEKDHFYAISHGSLYEVESQIEIAVAIGYLTEAEVGLVRQYCLDTSRLLHGLRRVNKAKGV
jgi:four helix bundle protein